MKKLLALVLIIVSVLSVIWVANRNLEPALTPSDASQPTPISTNGIIKKAQIGDFAVSYTDPFAGDQITLLPNFTDSETSRDLFTQNNCQVLVNGGFYSKTNQPIGLFLSEYDQISGYQNNSLFNGIVSVNDFDTPRITRNTPTDRLRLAIQTGPILIENASPRTLSIRNDSPNRRTVAAITGENKIFFLTIYDNDSFFSGPNLEDLPSVLEEFESQTGIEIADAINLDGGTASALQSNEVDINELSPIGSFFCAS